MTLSVPLEELRKIIREEVHRAFLEVMLELVPYISDEEQREIEHTAGSPEDYCEEDFIEWSGS